MVRKLKFHEQKLLRKVNFVNWEVDLCKETIQNFSAEWLCGLIGEQQPARGKDHEEVLHPEERRLHFVQQAV